MSTIQKEAKEEVSVPQKIWATGRRKTAVARVELIPEGKGSFLINGRDYKSFFPLEVLRQLVIQPLKVAGLENKVDIKVKVHGGGNSGQAGAVRLGISRTLIKLDPALRGKLKKEGFLTRDPRAKERKKYGQKGARRKFQWTKR